jgi:hypothetical protein
VAAAGPIELRTFSRDALKTTNRLVGDSEHFVSLKRARSDPQYAKGVIRHHNSIKRYLASPLKGDREFEQLINLLLETGFSIDDLLPAYVSLHLCGGPNPSSSATQLRNAGLSEERTRWIEQRARESARKARAMCIAHNLGLENDPEVLNLFLNVYPERSEHLGPASEFIPEVPMVDGEQLLTDDDWMSPERLRLRDGYRGPPRGTGPGRPERPQPDRKALAPARLIQVPE